MVEGLPSDHGKESWRRPGSLGEEAWLGLDLMAPTQDLAQILVHDQVQTVVQIVYPVWCVVLDSATAIIIIFRRNLLL